MKPEPQDTSLPSLANCVDWTTLFGSGHVACVGPVFLQGSGTKAYSNAGLTALLIMVVYAAAAPCPILLPYIPIWLCFVVYRRIRADRREHRYFRGWFFRNSFLWRVVEPVFYLLLGAVLFLFDEALGRFVMAMFLSQSAVLAIQTVSLSERIGRMRDAQVGMEYLAEMERRR